MKLTLFDGASVTLTFAKVAGASPTDQPKTFVRVEHSDPKHPANATGKKAVFIAAPWLAEQVPASYADFKKAQEAYYGFQRDQIAWFRVCENPFDDFMAHIRRA